MTEGLVRPNLHAVLIHAPLGLLMVGTAIEFFAFLWRRSSLRVAGRWMILFGALSLVPVAMAGLYALNQVNRTSDTEYENWANVRAVSPIQGPAWEALTEHAWWTAGGSVIVLLVVVLWLGASDTWRERLHLVFLLLLVFGLAVIMAGAWHGGEVVYAHAVGVKTIPGPAPMAEWTDRRKEIALETHVILAGVAVSLGLAGIGLSLRAGAQRRVVVEGMPDPANIGAALNPNARAVGYSESSYSTGAAGYPMTAPPDGLRVPVARFFLLATLVAVITLLTGWWRLAEESSVWTVNELWQIAQDRGDGDMVINRRMAHIAAGAAIVVLMLVMAVVSRFLAGRRIVISFFALLLIAVVAAQIWFGSLLMFDMAEGSLGSFTGAAADPLHAPVPEPASEPSSAPATATAPTTTPAE